MAAPDPKTAEDAYRAGAGAAQVAYESGVIPAIPATYRDDNELFNAFLAGYGAEMRAAQEQEDKGGW